MAADVLFRINVSVVALALMLAVAHPLIAKQPKHFNGTTSEATQELIVAAYKILQLGYDCHASGATIEACRGQLQTQLNARLR
jgi:hypothetical protein